MTPLLASHCRNPLLHVCFLRLGLKPGVREWTSSVLHPEADWGYLPLNAEACAQALPVQPVPYDVYREDLIRARGGRKRGRKDGGDDFYTDAFWYFCPDRDQSLANTQVDAQEIDDSKTWQDVEWDVVRESVARQCEADTSVRMTPAESQRYEAEARSSWNRFYQKHENKFFQTRHYFLREFPFLEPSEGAPRRLLEVGCGTGSTAFPLMELDPWRSDYWYLTDLSDSAIATLKLNPLYDEATRCTAVAHDITQSDLPAQIPRDIDIALLIFVLSAISPSQMQLVVDRIYDRLKPGGQLIFRDYGLYDMVQMRFIGKGKPKLDDNFYLRSDGTRAFFFSLEKCQDLFSRSGFQTLHLSYDVRQLKNRKRKILFHRVWIKAILQKPLLNQ